MTARWIQVTAALGCAAATIGCASASTARPSPFPGAHESGAAEIAPAAPSETGTLFAPAPALASAVIQSALLLRGLPYRFGGDSPATGFDCSGLISYVARLHGINIPRTVVDQYGTGFAVARSDVEPGDLIFYSTTGPGPTHVGLVVSTSGRLEFVHAPSDGSTVRIERFDTTYWEQRWVGARRVF